MPSIKSVVNKVKGGKAKSMKDLLSSSLTKLKITSYSDPKYSTSNNEIFEVQFNPNKVDESISVEYVDGEQVQGSTNSPKKFKVIKPATLKLSVTLDGTGASGQELDVSVMIDKFRKVTYDYNGNKHDVPYLKIEWGYVKFDGRLQSLNISHVLFKSDGNPLRSVLDATFTTAVDLKTQALEAKKQSPDLTHTRTVKVGDTLPLMCTEIYNDPSYYLKIAKFNNIVDFRNLEPGTEIIFPPIV